jgi:hypothetical protein
MMSVAEILSWRIPMLHASVAREYGAQGGDLFGLCLATDDFAALSRECDFIAADHRNDGIMWEGVKITAGPLAPGDAQAEIALDRPHRCLLVRDIKLQPKGKLPVAAG